jgi:orotidine-5'-phosphate decarboxylase
MNRILVALDVDRAEAAITLADALRGAVGGVKVGMQLFTAAGPDVVRALVERGDRVFLDLKFHDIPNTVAGAVAAAAELGVWMVNVHAGGGFAMLEAARRGAEEGARRAGRPVPIVLGVTVLTSLSADALHETGVPDSPADQVVRLARLCQRAGLDGVVASPQELVAVRQAAGSAFVIVTPGIRGGAAASGRDDQARTATASQAVAAGATYLVVGRPITGAPDPRAAAEQIAAEAGTGDTSSILTLP